MKVTVRSIFLGVISSALVGYVAAYSTHVIQGTPMELDFSTPLTLFIFFLLVAVPQIILWKLRRPLALTPAELATIYGMSLMSSAVATMGLASQLPAALTGVFYFASPTNQFSEEIIPYLRPWLFPTGASPHAELITNFYRGLPPGHSIPWAAFLRPLASWALLLSAVYVAMIALMVLFRKQWVENERLAYPLAVLPLELLGEKSHGFPLLLTKPWFWLGFSVASVLACLYGLRIYFAGFPCPNLAPTLPVVANLWRIDLRISIPMVGFFYLVNLDLLFSLWSFNLLFQTVGFVMSVYKLNLLQGVGPFGSRNGLFKFMGSGAFLALCGTILWSSRRTLRNIWSGKESDHQEILSYSQVKILLLLSFLVICLWLYALGLPLLAVGVFVVLAFAFFLALTRTVVEGGVAEAVAPSIAPGMTAALLGTRFLGREGMIALAANYVWASDIRTFVMASTANALRLSSVVEERKGWLFPAYLLAIVTGFLFAFWVTMRSAYHLGGENLGAWFFGSDGVPTVGYKWVVERLATSAGPSLGGWVALLIGAGLYLGIAHLRFRFPLLPLHPMGFALAQTWLMDALWYTPFLVWVFKLMLVRWGGRKAYEKMRPFFLGLVLGQYSMNVLWLGIDQVTGHRPGAGLFWI